MGQREVGLWGRFQECWVWRVFEGDSEGGFQGFRGRLLEKTSDTYCWNIRGVASGNISGKRRRMEDWGQSGGSLRPISKT